MATAQLAEIRTFPQLVKYLKDELDWPITTDDFEELTYNYTAEELGIDAKNAARIEQIKRLKPLDVNQPWGVFFVKFEPKSLPVVALRRILGSVVVKKRASANKSEQAAWNAEDLLFISNYGQGEARQISFAHFSENPEKNDLPTLKVLGWDQLDTALHIEDVVETLKEHLTWPDDPSAKDAWRDTWRSAFTLGHKEVITTSKALAIRLAQLARAIRDRIQGVIEVENDKGPVTKLMKAFQDALIHDLDVEGFADMYAQTIAYGLLSARVTNPHADTADGFTSQLPVTNPFLKELMETFLNVGGRRKGAGIDFDELGVNEVVELLDRAKMEAIIRDFGDRKPEEDPVIHFYELFMNEYSPSERVRRGIFYTPQPVVSFIVRSVHELLQTEFRLEDGLADTVTWGEMIDRIDGLTLPPDVRADDRFISILDPAAGTGTFLVEVIGVIHETLEVKWKNAGHTVAQRIDLWNDYVSKELLSRLHGYELLMAPYAICHLKIGLKLHETGYRFTSDERARVYLTNSLEAPQEIEGKLEFTIPALAHEAAAVNEVKKTRRFTVIVGNPPYSLMSANLGPAERQLVEAYKYVDGERLIERGALQLQKNLQDDYVKFIRFSELRCREVPIGIMSLITNHAYLDNPTLRGMRRSLMTASSRSYFLDLHGNAKRHEVSPLPEKDVNVFDIQQGVAVSLLVRNASEPNSTIRWGELWGSRERKYQALLSETLETLASKKLQPKGPLFLFVAQDEGLRGEFDIGIPLDEMFDLYSTGIATARDALTVHFTKPELRSVLEDLARLPAERARTHFGLGPDTNDWKVSLAKQDLKDSGCSEKNFHKVLYRPFDRRWTYYTGRARGFLCNPRRPVMQHLLDEDNMALCASKSVETGHAYAHVFITNTLSDHHCVSLKEVNYIFPLLTFPSAGEGELDLEDPGSGPRTNFSRRFQGMLQDKLGLAISLRTSLSEDEVSPDALLGYVYAILQAPTYRSRYTTFLRKEFARIPLPASRELFRELATLGLELLECHLVVHPALEKDFERYQGQSSPVVGRVAWQDDKIWLDRPSRAKTQTVSTTAPAFHDVSEAMWEFHVGGYRVCEKWLKDRKTRKLTKREIQEFQKVLRAVEETLRLRSVVDEQIKSAGGWPAAFAPSPTSAD